MKEIVNIFLKKSKIGPILAQNHCDLAPLVWRGSGHGRGRRPCSPLVPRLIAHVDQADFELVRPPPPAIVSEAGSVELVSKGPDHRTPMADWLAEYWLAGRRGKTQVHGHPFLGYWGSEAVCEPGRESLPPPRPMSNILFLQVFSLTTASFSSSHCLVSSRQASSSWPL